MSVSDLAVLVPKTIANNMVVLADHEIMQLMTEAFKITGNGSQEARVAVALVHGVTSKRGNC